MAVQTGMSKFARLAPAVALATAILLVVAGVVLALYVDRTNERQQADQLLGQARILAATVTAALAFNDRDAAMEYVDAIRANPDMLAAAVYDSHGALFASFPHAPTPLLPSSVVPEPPRSDEGRLSVAVAVEQNGARLGTVYLETAAQPLLERAERYGVIALLGSMAALVLGVLGVSQRALGRANASLQAQAEDLAAVNQQLREQIEQREKAEDALRQSQKMEAIGQLTGGVAHDFNNLLQVVIGSLDMLRTRARRLGGDREPLPDFERLLGGAMRGAERAAALTQRLLAFSRRQALSPKPLDVNRLVGGMSELLTRTLGEAIRVETVLAAGLWRVSADENQLENALLNLAVNARDAMRAGGKLTIETANAYLDEAYARSEQDVAAGQYIMLAVTDTGTGIPRDVIDRVFEPFFTTKGIGQGTGLGLSQVYGFIKQSGGHVKIYSEPGHGTTVRLYLPRLVGAESDLPDSLRAVGVPQSRRGEQILVVEDEADVRALTTVMLADLGYTVLEARDGASALGVLERAGEVALLFTDVGLPNGMNGRELAEAARLRRPGLRVLFTTGYARNAIVHHGRLDPGVDLISKPFSRENLAHKLRQILEDAPPAGAIRS